MKRKRKIVELEEEDNCVAREQLDSSDDCAMKNAVPQTEPCASNSTPVPKKLKRKTSGKKLITKPKRIILAKNLKKIEPAILVEEVKRSLTTQFSGSKNLGEFVAALCRNDQPLLTIAAHHRDDFARLYIDCNTKSNAISTKLVCTLQCISS